MGTFKRNIGIKLMGASKKLDDAVFASKKLDYKLKELHSITEQVTKGTNDQADAINATNALTNEMSKSISGVVINAEQLSNKRCGRQRRKFDFISKRGNSSNSGSGSINTTSIRK